jgi:hypothetical protein
MAGTVFYHWVTLLNLRTASFDKGKMDHAAHWEHRTSKWHSDGGTATWICSFYTDMQRASLFFLPQGDVTWW